MVILQKNKKIILQWYFISLLTHFWQIKFGLHNYGDSEKDWKTHEIAMKNGNFINVFLVKACSIIVTRKKYMGMDGRADFSKIWLFFLKGYLHFFFWCKIFHWTKGHFFGCHFFAFARVCFKKQQKKKIGSFNG